MALIEAVAVGSPWKPGDTPVKIHEPPPGQSRFCWQPVVGSPEQYPQKIPAALPPGAADDGLSGLRRITFTFGVTLV